MPCAEGHLFWCRAFYFKSDRARISQTAQRPSPITWKSSKLSNSVISLNWSIIDEVTTRNTTAYFFGPLCICELLVMYESIRRSDLMMMESSTSSHTIQKHLESADFRRGKSGPNPKCGVQGSGSG